jgi:glycosyltransferase involved in cell wall biosynthesis
MKIKPKSIKKNSPAHHSPKGQRQPLVSIITVCRNSEKTIAKTIESVLNQTHSNLEYIIIDGLSNDRTMEIVKQYEHTFKGRMRWISEHDDGIYDAMNKGIARAQGEVIGIINSDDWYEPEAVNIAVSAIKNNSTVIAYGMLRFYKDGREWMVQRNSHNYLQEFMIPHPASFVPKALYNKYGVFNTLYRYAADYEFMLRLHYAGVKFIPLDKIIANFQMEGVSIRKSDATYIERLYIQHQYQFISLTEVYRNILRVRIRNLMHLSKRD